MLSEDTATSARRSSSHGKPSARAAARAAKRGERSHGCRAAAAEPSRAAVGAIPRPDGGARPPRFLARALCNCAGIIPRPERPRPYSRADRAVEELPRAGRVAGGDRGRHRTRTASAGNPPKVHVALSKCGPSHAVLAMRGTSTAAGESSSGANQDASWWAGLSRLNGTARGCCTPLPFGRGRRAAPSQRRPSRRPRARASAYSSPA